MKRTVSFVLAMLMVLSSTTSVLAAGTKTKTATLTYSNIKVTIDGKQVELKDKNEPFVIDGTTYLPVRAIGEALGLDVAWDGETSTVALTTKSASTTTSAPTKSTTSTTSIPGSTKSTEKTYVLNTNTKKFHTQGCSSVSQIKSSNKGSFTGSRADLIAKGYTPCKKCNP